VKGIVCAVPLLLVPLLLTLLDMEVCELPRMAHASCSSAPAILYEVMIAAGAICLLHSIYRGYRDFVRGDLERDLAVWSGQVLQRARGDQEVAAAQPRADASNATSLAPVSLDPISASDDENTNDIKEKIEAMFAQLHRDEGNTEGEPQADAVRREGKRQQRDA
jgi:hypothetical protein